MARFWYGQGILAVGDGRIDLGTADIKILLLMTATTADVEFDENRLSGFTDLDEPTTMSSGYARAGLSAQSVGYTIVPDRRVEAKSTPVDLITTAVNVGITFPRDIQAYMVFYDPVPGDDTEAIPLVYDSTPAIFPVTIEAGDNLSVFFTGDVWTFLASDPLPA